MLSHVDQFWKDLAGDEEFAEEDELSGDDELDE